MSQQYGPPPGPPPAPAPSGWGTGQQAPQGPHGPQGRPGGAGGGMQGGMQGGGGPGGGWGPGPLRPARPPKPNRTPWIIMAGAIVAVLLVAVGVVLLVNGKDEGNNQAGGPQTPEPIGTMYTPSPTPTPDDSKGPNDIGVEVGNGIWFTPSKGWLPDWDKTKAGKNYILQQFNARGLIDGYYWVRQTELYDAKGFAEHLVDLESNGMEGVRIGKGTVCKPANPKIKACYALTYTGIWVGKSGKKVSMQGFVTAYQDEFDRVTATDAGLEVRVYARRVNELVYMNNSVIKSF